MTTTSSTPTPEQIERLSQHEPREIEINLTAKSDEELLAEIKRRQETRAELKAKVIRVLDRGMVSDRLAVPLPGDTYGEWVPNDKLEIYRMQSMGFDIDKEYASKRALHDKGDGGTSVVGDVVFMTCPREVKEVIDEVRREQYEAANSPRGGMQKEERDFAAEVKSVGLPDQMKSRVDAATLENIKQALTVETGK